MTRLTSPGAVILAVTAVSMMLFIMNAGNSPLVRWGAFLLGSAAVLLLAFGHPSSWNRHQK